MSFANGVLTRSANWHHKQAQRTAAYDRDRPILAVTVDDRMVAYMRFSANLYQLKGLDRIAWERMNERMDKGGESWQALDVDVCHELDRHDSLSEQGEQNAMRRGE